MASASGPSVSASSLSRLLSLISHPFTVCLPSNSDRRGDELPSAVRGAYRGHDATIASSSSSNLDSDAISLLSNVAGMTPTPSRSRAAARERARERKRGERGRQSGLCGMGDWASELIAGGLFGQTRTSRLRRTSRRSHINFSREGEERYQSGSSSEDSLVHDEHEELLGSQDSQELATGSGDEDAQPIALVVSDARLMDSQPISKAVAEGRETVDRKSKDKLIERSQTTRKELEEEGDITLTQAAEEAMLAHEEEQVVAESQHRARKKAIREGLLHGDDPSRGKSSKRSEAEIEARAEAAAGGFESTEEDEGWDAEYQGVPDDLQSRNAPKERHQAHGSLDVGETEEEYLEDTEDQGGPRVVHHHHYYDYPEQRTTSPTISEAKSGDDETSQQEQDEFDEADMAGLGFSSKKAKKRLFDNGSSAGGRSSSAALKGSGSGSGSTSASASCRYSRKSDRNQYPIASAPVAATVASVSSSGSNRSRSRYQLPNRRRNEDLCAESQHDDMQTIGETLQDEICHAKPRRDEDNYDGNDADAAAGGLHYLDESRHLALSDDGDHDDDDDPGGSEEDEGDQGEEEVHSRLFSSHSLGSTPRERSYREKRPRSSVVRTRHGSEVVEEDGADGLW